MTKKISAKTLASQNDHVTPVENFFGTTNKGSADVTVLGIPLSTTELTFGVEFFPAFLRKATAKYSHLERFHESGVYSELMTKPSPLVVAKGVSVADAGDLSLEGRSLSDVTNQLSAFWKSQLTNDSKPIFVGGDHAITYLILKSLNLLKPNLMSDLTVLHFDAHNDFLNQNEIRLHHASPIYNCVHELGVRKVKTFGARTLTDSRVLKSHDRNSLKLFLQKVELTTPIEIAKIVADFVSQNQPLTSKAKAKAKPKAYLTIDLDVLDASEIGSAVGVPLTGGITWDQLYVMILKLRAEYNIIGCDITEGRVFGYENPLLLKKTLFLMLILLDVLKYPKASFLSE